MSDTTLVALISGASALLGALIGGCTTGAVTWIQQRAQTRRDLVRLSAEIELAQLKTAAEAAVEGMELHLGNSSEAIVSYFRLLDALMRHGPDSEKVKVMVQSGITKVAKRVSG
jgi:hypothetical protein